MVEEKEECCSGGPLGFWEVVCIHKRSEGRCSVLIRSSSNLILLEGCLLIVLDKVFGNIVSDDSVVAEHIPIPDIGLRGE